MLRLFKNFDLLSNNNMTVIYGTPNRIEPKVIYINGKLWIKPTKNMDYVNESNEVAKEFRKSIKKALIYNNVFDRLFMCDFDIKPIGFELNKSKFISFEITLKQSELISMNDIKSEIEKIFLPLFDELVENFNAYDFQVNKQKF